MFRLRTSSQVINRLRNLLASSLATAPLKDLVAAMDVTSLAGFAGVWTRYSVVQYRPTQ